MTGIPDAFVYDSIRTPRGRGKAAGALHEVRPIALVAGLIQETLRRHPDLDPGDVEDVILGIVTPAGDQGGCLPKAAAMLAGMPDTTSGVQLSRFCASGLESINQAAARVRSGMEDLVLAGGLESMSRVPMFSEGVPWMNDPATALATDFVPQGISADLIATIEGFTREDCDAYAATSHARAAAAWEDGRFAESVIPVRDLNGLTILERDETIRPGTSVESLSALRPSFVGAGAAGFDDIALQRHTGVERIDHVHHAGNSSGIVDGAALTLVGSAAAGARAGLTPRARIVSYAVSGADPVLMLVGPGPASRKALAKAGLRAEDIDLVEINEAFAAVVLRFVRELGFDHEQVNVNGGAIAMGHPLGATGSMILGTLIDELHRRQLRYGLATLCVGGGMGIATIVERL